MLSFVQQRTHLTMRIDVCQLSKAVRPVVLRSLLFGWLSHPQLEASLFDVYATL